MRRTILTLSLITGLVAAWSAWSGAAETPGRSDTVLEPEEQQPDYKAWAKLRRGLTEIEVIDLLGRPWKRSEDPDPSVGRVWYYGPIADISDPFPRAYAFEVWFSDGSVVTWSDPFEGRFSRDGKPTTPQPLAAPEFSRFHHYPRFIDLRWLPSSGRYPMSYEVEIASYQGRPGLEWAPRSEVSSVPYLAHSFVGMQRGRWRVRAINELGKSEWSEYREFEFTR